MEAAAYFLDRPGAPLARRTLTLPDPGERDVVVEVTACGLCHTDLGFADGSVAPRHALPLVLGHEIVGVVRAAGQGARDLLGAKVLVPAVLPCGACELCTSGRANACTRQKMPGNDIDGGFATHVLVPASALVSLDDAPPHLRVDSFSVVADAVSTAYQAIRRSGLRRGDAVFVVGGGGVGGFVAQIARALGGEVAVCDVDPARLQALASLGAPLTVDVRGREPRDVRRQLHAWANDQRAASPRWRIFECSGTTAGQMLAYTLLGQAATMVVVGFTREPVNVRLSNLMAFDATLHGSWGCPPEAYPAVLRLIYDGDVQIEPFIERAPLSRINELLAALGRHELGRRMVLDPNA